MPPSDSASGTRSTAMTGLCTLSKTSIICFSAGGVASKMSSPSTTANGSSPTRPRAHRTI
jgi:hypothetical protein